MKISKIMFGLLTVILMLALGATPAVFAADTIKVGEVQTYSKLASFTHPYRNGWQLALEEINNAGGVMGKKIEVISRDDQGKPGEAVKVAEELVAKRNKVLFVAAEPLSDAVVWAKGNRYTFRLRPSTYMQAAMLAVDAAKNPAKRWATIAPNYAYGKDAVASFKKVLKAKRPDVEFVAEQWPALFKINAGAEIQALADAKPEAVYNVTFGGDLAKFVREGKLRGFFKNVFMVSLLSGEPEYLDPLKGEAPEGWLVTGYPWYDIKTPAHTKFVEAYQKKFNDYPRTGSVVGYNTMYSVYHLLKKAGTTDTEKMVDAMEGLTFDSIIGPVSYRKIDHQSTMGAFVGYTALKDGKGVMVNWKYADGQNYLPSDAEVMKMRPQ